MIPEREYGRAESPSLRRVAMAAELRDGDESGALLALSHTPIEHRLYETLRAETSSAGTRVAAYSIRRLMELTGLSGYSTIRRGLIGLQDKLSIEHHKVAGDAAPCRQAVYYVFTPAEILARRRAVEMMPYPKELQARDGGATAFGTALFRFMNKYGLSRREAQVAICCTEGLTNAEIGDRLCISEDTAKSHLRNVYVKCGVRRRAELVARLLSLKGG